jgi:hypothetical protein
MSPAAFARIVRRIEPLIDARLSVESRDALARHMANFDNLDSHIREDIISICSELFLWVGAGRRR